MELDNYGERKHRLCGQAPRRLSAASVPAARWKLHHRWRSSRRTGPRAMHWRPTTMCRFGGMDPETIRLIVTASGAVIAGLGGAGITGWINRKNTTATLHATRQTHEDQWLRTHAREHEVWLRDRREESYVAFFDEAELHHVRLGEYPTEKIELGALQKLRTHRARITLIGSPEMRQEANNLTLAVGKALIARNKLHATISMFTGEDRWEERKRQKEVTSDWKSNLDALRKAISEFSSAVRLEFRTSADQLSVPASRPADLENSQNY